jgi:chromosome segregation ATPase
VIAALAAALSGCATEGADDELSVRVDRLDTALEARVAEEGDLDARVDELERELELLRGDAEEEGDDPLAELDAALADLDRRVDQVADSRATEEEAAAAAQAAVDEVASDLRGSLDEVRGATDQVRGEVEELRTLYETLRDRLDAQQR